MPEIDPIADNKHDELLRHLMPLVDFMNQNGYSYFLVAGKDGKCARYVNGDIGDVTYMITGLAEKHKQVKVMLERIHNDIKLDKNGK